jgi:hypothetical protein
MGGLTDAMVDVAHRKVSLTLLLLDDVDECTGNNYVVVAGRRVDSSILRIEILCQRRRDKSVRISPKSVRQRQMGVDWGKERHGYDDINVFLNDPDIYAVVFINHLFSSFLTYGSSTSSW